MICKRNFEIRIVLLRKLPSCKDYLSLLSNFDLSPRFSSRLYNSTPKRYFFNALELLKCPTMFDITEEINFDIPFMIWRKNFEIRIVLLRELPSSKYYLSLLSYFDLNPRFSLRLYNSTPKR